ncbi:kinase-like domain-containing protein, partial [Chytridium lagenaria]
ELCGHTLQDYLVARNKVLIDAMVKPEEFASQLSFSGRSATNTPPLPLPCPHRYPPPFRYDRIHPIYRSVTFQMHRPITSPLDLIDLNECLGIFKDVCEGLSYVHEQNCIHRDIAPKNLFWVPNEEDPASRREVWERARSKDPSLASFSPSGIAASTPSRHYSDCLPLSKGFEKWWWGGLGHWKIGDFGLVTMTSLAVPEPDDPSLVETEGKRKGKESSKRTAGVGTITYASPEQLSSTSISYTSKILHPFGTGMERATILSKLRTGVMPDGFVKRWPKEATLILWLMSDDPTKRPSARDVLDLDFFRPMPDITMTHSSSISTSFSSTTTSSSADSHTDTRVISVTESGTQTADEIKLPTKPVSSETSTERQGRLKPIATTESGTTTTDVSMSVETPKKPGVVQRIAAAFAAVVHPHSRGSSETSSEALASPSSMEKREVVVQVGDGDVVSDDLEMLRGRVKELEERLKKMEEPRP